MKLKTIEIQGKPYVEVSERINHFRNSSEFKGWGMETMIESQNDKNITMRCVIKNQEGSIISSGIAQEVAGSSFINKGSHVENCETSAVGRALGNLGIGTETSVASYDEVSNAKLNQNKQTKVIPMNKPKWNDSHYEPAVKKLQDGKTSIELLEKALDIPTSVLDKLKKIELLIK
tara:strand:+ start:43 stop:567 length:525 start_codon:yes stop_codon:yes gene_type:complete